MVKAMSNYEEGFEDAVQLCLTELKKSNRKKEAVSRLEYILGLVMEHKFDRIKQMLGVLK